MEGMHKKWFPAVVPPSDGTVSSDDDENELTSEMILDAASAASRGDIEVVHDMTN